jgi:hypothetical protein
MASPGGHKRTGDGEDSSSNLHTPGVVEWRSRKNVFWSSDELQFLSFKVGHSHPLASRSLLLILLSTFTPAFGNLLYITHLNHEIYVFGQWL